MKVEVVQLEQEMKLMVVEMVGDIGDEVGNVRTVLPLSCRDSDLGVAFSSVFSWSRTV